MKTQWAEVPIGEVAYPNARREEIQPTNSYRQIGIRLWGNGAYDRGTILGSETEYKNLFRMSADDIVVNKIWARNGSVAVVPPELDGIYGSGEFPSFTPDRSKIEPRWFHWLTQWKPFWVQCDEKSRGATGKNRIKSARFLEVKIPLPPLPEQRRIVAKIDEIAARVEEAKRLRMVLEDERNTFLAQMANHFDLSQKQKQSMGWKAKKLADVLIPYTDACSVKENASYPNIGVFSFGRGIFLKPPIEGTETKATTLYRVRSGQFIYSRLFAFEGAYGYVSPEADGAFVSGEFPAFNCHPGELIAEFLFCYFKSPTRWRQLRENCKGLGGRRQRLKVEYFLPHEIMLPPVEYQLATKKALESFAKGSQIRDDIQTELEALMPSLLDQAFRGEL